MFRSNQPFDAAATTGAWPVLVERFIDAQDRELSFKCLDRVFSLAEARAAMRRLQLGTGLGKIILAHADQPLRRKA